MSKADRSKALLILVIAGFMGGAVSRTVLDIIPRVSAQREKANQTITAGSFVLVDNEGRKRAALFVTPHEQPYGDVTSLAFYDGKGQEVINLQSVGGMRSSSLMLIQNNSSIFLEARPSDPSLSLKDCSRSGTPCKTLWSAP